MKRGRLGHAAPDFLEKRRNHPPEPGALVRRGVEIATGADSRAFPAIIAALWMIEGEFHEPAKGDGAVLERIRQGSGEFGVRGDFHGAEYTPGKDGQEEWVWKERPLIPPVGISIIRKRAWITASRMRYRMRIRVKCFAWAKEVTGEDEIDLEVPEGATVADLRVSLAERFPIFFGAHGVHRRLRQPGVRGRGHAGGCGR